MPIKIRIAEYIKTKELSENIAGGSCEQQTLISYYHEKGKIVYVFDCDESTPTVYGDKDNDKLYKGDIVEVMITLESQQRYLEVSLNPAKLKYAAIVNNTDGKGNNLIIEPLEENPIDTDIILTDTGYIAKIIIPIDWLKELGWSAESAFTNIFRQDFNTEGELRLYALSPTRSASFHKTDSFVPMEIL